MSKSASSNENIQVVQQAFDDKVIIRNEDNISVVCRDSSSLELDFTSANLKEPPRTLTSPITLKIEEKMLDTLFRKVNWSSLFKENNEIINAFAKSFFDGMLATA